MTLTETLAAALDRCLAAHVPRKLGVAVSGGSDSLALMLILSEICTTRGLDLFAATVDHNLRSGSADEARFVARVAEREGIPHSTLTWSTGRTKGNLQAAARTARYDLLREWAHKNGIDTVCLGHTRDDQAETVLLRLARGSGVDGLSGMPQSWIAHGVHWLRPALKIQRTSLRAWLQAAEQPWCDDPSNSDIRFDRVQARNFLQTPGVPGLDTDTLADTADRMAAAKVVLNQAAAEAAENLVQIQAGDVVLDGPGLFDLPDDTRWRLLAHCLCWVSRAEYRPRLKSLRALEATVRKGRRATLHGCLVIPKREGVRVGREPAALRKVRSSAPGVWDGRWELSTSEKSTKRLHVAALGETGLNEVPKWRETGLRRETLLTSPAIFDQGNLVAAPVAGVAQGWAARLIQDKEDLIETLLSR